MSKTDSSTDNLSQKQKEITIPEKANTRQNVTEKNLFTKLSQQADKTETDKNAKLAPEQEPQLVLKKC